MSTSFAARSLRGGCSAQGKRRAGASHLDPPLLRVELLRISARENLEGPGGMPLQIDFADRILVPEPVRRYEVGEQHVDARLQRIDERLIAICLCLEILHPPGPVRLPFRLGRRCCGRFAVAVLFSAIFICSTACRRRLGGSGLDGRRRLCGRGLGRFGDDHLRRGDRRRRRRLGGDGVGGFRPVE